MILELAKYKESAPLLAKALADKTNLLRLSELLTGKRNSHLPFETWPSVFSSLLPYLTPAERKEFFKNIAKYWLPKEYSRSRYYFQFLKANKELPETAEVLESLKKRQKTDSFSKEVYMAFLLDKVFAAKSPIPEFGELLDEKADDINSALRVIPRAVAAQDPNFRKKFEGIAKAVAEGKFPQGGFFGSSAEGILSWMGGGLIGPGAPPEKGDDNFTPLIVPYLAGLLKARRNWSYDNPFPITVGGALNDWIKNSPERAQQVMSQLEEVVFDPSFMNAKNAVTAGMEKDAAADRVRHEQDYRNRHMVQLISIAASCKEGDQYLQKHPKIAKKLADEATGQYGDWVVGWMLFPDALTEELKRRLPSATELKSKKEVPAWIDRLAKTDVQCTPKMIEYAKATHDNNLIQALKELVHSQPEKLSIAQKDEIDKLVFSNAPLSGEGVFK